MLKTFAQGKATLVVEVDSADIIATIILLKMEVEQKFESKVKMTLTGALEAHILAKEIADAKIGVVQVPSRPFPTTWERLRMYVCYYRGHRPKLKVFLQDFRVIRSRTKARYRHCFRIT